MSSDPATLRGLDAEKHLADPVLKQHYVTTMFEIIAPCYDRFTRTFSLGKDVGWKRELLDLARGQLPRGARVLDLACGSGDLALGLAADTDGVRSTGVDVSRNMIAIAERRRRDEQTLDATFTLGTMVQLPVSRASIDAVTVGYGLRNAPGLGAALDEIERVLKPGGRLYCLDFFKPKPTFWRTVWLGYLAAAGDAYGWLWHGDPAVYGYIARSIRHFVSWQELCEALEARHFVVEEMRPKMLGGISLVAASKSQRPSG
jgi:demethylmenaquinone methyltransferase/2-methoxy-6-polyprenyl-1,4-benzoquinol methylase